MRGNFLALTTAALALAVMAGGARAATNILLNSGFETGSLSPWTATFAPTVTSAYAHSGTYSVREFSQDAVKQTFAPVATSAITEISFWVDRPVGDVLINGFYLTYSDGTAVYNYAELPNYTGGWHKFDITADLAANKNLTGFLLYGTSLLPGSDPAYIDDITISANGISAAPELSSWGMMLVGFAGLGVLGLRSRTPNRA